MKQNLFDLTGRTAAVIGGASGIGEAVALGCAGQGARVFCLDLNEDAARKVAARATSDGCSCEAGAIDIRDSAAVDRVLADIDAKHGLDIVICTPSINVRKPILRYTDEELARVLDVNLKGNFYVLRTAGRLMTARRKGSIILFRNAAHGADQGEQSVVRRVCREERLQPVGPRRRACGRDGVPGVRRRQLCDRIDRVRRRRLARRRRQVHASGYVDL